MVRPAARRGASHMTCFDELDILGDESLRERMVRWSATVLVATVVLVAFALVVAWPGLLRAAMQLAGGFAACLVVLPVHELVHGAAFKLLGGPEVKVSFGHAAGCLYTRTNDAVLSRRRFVAVLLAPSVALTVLLVGVGAALGAMAGGILAAGLHLTGCTGDLIMVAAIAREPRARWVQDTESGCRLLA